MPVRRTREDKVRAGQRRADGVFYTLRGSETGATYTIPSSGTRVNQHKAKHAPLAYDVAYIMTDLKKTLLFSLFIIGLQLVLFYYIHYS